MLVEGTWNLSISTPIGKIRAAVELREQDGVLTGVAHGAGEEVPLGDLTLDGDRLYLEAGHHQAHAAEPGVRRDGRRRHPPRHLEGRPPAVFESHRRAPDRPGVPGVTELLLSLHVLAAIVAVGPVTVASSMFPATLRRARRLRRRRRPYDPADAAPHLPGLRGLRHRGSLFGFATASSLGVLGDAWLITSILLTARPPAYWHY